MKKTEQTEAENFLNWLCENGYSTLSRETMEKGVTLANYSHSGKWQYTTKEAYELFKAAGCSAKNNGA